jgi:hypothetical protein
MSQDSTELHAAMMTMTYAMSIRHVFDGTLRDRGAGVLRYALVIGVRCYLVWHDDDADEMVVSPVGLWDAENVADIVDATLPTWFLTEGGKPGCVEISRSVQLGARTTRLCVG